jgi:probable lipoprotein NlpC
LSFKEGLNYTIPRSTEGLYAWAEQIATAELQPGDLVFFVTEGSKVSHVGIYAGEGRFINSASEGPRTGVIYSRLDESYWKRTYKGAGRALPWDNGAAQAMASARPGGSAVAENPGRSAKPALSGSASEDTGFFVGFGAAWTWGGFSEGAPSAFRSISALATAGYKWSAYRAGLELRPEWDSALGVFRLPFTLSIGTDIFQVFAGPVYTFGDPGLNLESGNRYYKGRGAWLWEAGVSGAFPPIRIGPGALSFYGELAWQPYHWEDGKDFSFKPDITANLRVSTGIRYLWRVD